MLFHANALKQEKNVARDLDFADSYEHNYICSDALSMSCEIPFTFPSASPYFIPFLVSRMRC